MIPLTISVVTANNKQLILDCLSSIYETTKGLEFEIYVVANNSSDDSEEAIRENFPEVKLIINRKKLGFTYNHNMVMRRAEGKYILVLNDDTLILNGALRKMVDFMEASPDVGILGCKILNPDGSRQWSCGKMYSHKFEHLATGILQPFMPFLQDKNLESTQEVCWVSGACLLARTESALEVGPFDENIIIYYEDVDWCYRMVQAGWKVVFYSDAEIIHYHGQTRKKNMARDTFIIYQSRNYFLSKHYGRMAQLLVKILTILEVSLRYLRTLTFSHLSADQRHDLLKTYRRILKLTVIPSA